MVQILKTSSVFNNIIAFVAMRSNSALAFLRLLLLIALAESATSTRLKPPILGGIEEQDPSDPVYLVLATKSLNKYMDEHGLTTCRQVMIVTRARTQLVAGTITYLDFTALSGSAPVTCTSKILEQPWLKIQEINVTCDYILLQHRARRGLLGGENPEDVNDPLVRELAEESLNKFVADYGITQHPRAVVVKKATMQVVSGYIHRIQFDALLDSSPITCRSEIYEQPWTNTKTIAVNCANLDQPIPGGEAEEDVNNPIYTQLALKALEKYKTEKGITLCTEHINVFRVTEQVVAGKLIRINFTANFVYSNGIICNSKILQQAWLNKEEIEVDCGPLLQ